MSEDDIVVLFRRYSRSRTYLDISQALGYRPARPVEFECVPEDVDELAVAVMRERLRLAWIEAHPPPAPGDDDGDEPPDDELVGWGWICKSHDADAVLAWVDSQASDAAHQVAVGTLRSLLQNFRRTDHDAGT
jgi:hypothetical protein